MKFEAKLPETNVNVGKTPPWLDFLWLCGGFVGVGVLLWVLLGFAADWVAPHVPRKMEQAIGSSFPLPGEEGGGRDRLLRELGAELAAAAPEEPGPIEVAERGMGMVNAFALPGGRIVFSSELLDEAESLNEVAFVLAHEIAHVAHRDALRAMGRGLLLALAGTVFMNADSSVQTFLGSTMNLNTLHYSREQEEAADLFALKAVAARFGHAGGALDLFGRLAEREGKGFALPEFLSTHPGTAGRIDRLKREAAAMGLSTGDPTPLPADWKSREERDGSSARDKTDR
jgi:predicted Zn-dependent protease